RRDAIRLAALEDAAPLVLPFLGDELLLAARDLDLVGELVLLDRALLFHGHGATLEGRFVRVLLDPLARRRLQRLLQLGRGRDARDAHGYDGETHFREARVLREA